MQIPDSKFYNDSDIFEEELNRIDSSVINDVIKEILTSFNKEERIELLNSYALFFSDNSINQSVPLIIERIKSGKYDGYLGTLVYALEELDITKHIYEILDFSIYKGYEVFEMSLSLFDRLIQSDLQKVNLIEFVPYVQGLKTRNSEEDEYKEYFLKYLKNPQIRD